MRKVTALIVCKRKVAGATKKVAVATFARARKKTIQNSSFELIEKKLQLQLFFREQKLQLQLLSAQRKLAATSGCRPGRLEAHGYSCIPRLGTSEVNRRNVSS